MPKELSKFLVNSVEDLRMADTAVVTRIHILYHTVSYLISLFMICIINTVSAL